MFIKKRRTLGNQIAVYKRPPLSWSIFFTTSCLGVATVLIPLNIGLKTYTLGYTTHGPIAALFWSRPWYLLTILNLIFYCLIVAIIRINSRRRVILHQHGLLVKDYSKHEIYWNEIFGIAHGYIQSFFLSYPILRRRIVSIHLMDGKNIKLDPNFLDLDILIKQIQSRVIPMIAPKIEKKFLEGNWLEFGIIRLDKSVISIFNQEIPWTEIKHMKVKSGFLVIEMLIQPNIVVPIDKIPNLELVLRIAKAGATVR